MVLRSQKPNSVYLAYLGQTVTHLGIKIGAHYELKSWETKKTRKKLGEERVTRKIIEVNPSISYLHHRYFQKNLLLFPEMTYTRKNQKGNYVAAGVGAGYMRTFVSSVYYINDQLEIKRTPTGYNYFISNFSTCAGKDLSYKGSVPLSIYIKPQLMWAMNSKIGGIWYFNLEAGINLKLSSKKE